MGLVVRHVLIADDNSELADNLGEVLRAEGHRVAVAHDSRQALGWAASFRYDVALVDLLMPDMNGVELVRRLMRERREPSYLFMTGGADEALVRTAGVLSCHPVLPKPIDLECLLRTLGGLGSPSQRF